jgi:hypothetical protein
VIAEPNQTVTKAEPEASPLTQQELYQLTLYKWRYSLEAYGFETQEVKDLMFLKWLHTSRHLEP